MENKRRRKKGKTGPEPEERDERVKNTGRRDEKEVRMGAGGDEGEDCSRAARLAAICFVVVAQLRLTVAGSCCSSSVAVMFIFS